MTKLSLKENMRRKNKRVLQEKLKKFDNLLNETKKNQILTEAMDENDLRRVSQIINKLRIMQNYAKDSRLLRQSIDDALNDLQEITGSETSLGQKFKNALGLGKNTKIFKDTMALVSALESGFRYIPTILNNMIGSVQSDSEDADLPAIEIIYNQTSNDQTGNSSYKKINILVKNISKAMKPSKWWGLKTGDSVPYVSDLDKLVHDMMSTTPVKNLMHLVKTISSGPQASTLAQDVANGGGGETSGTEGTSQSNVTSDSSDSEQSSDNVKYNNLITKIQSVTDVDPDSVGKVIAYLANQNKLKESADLTPDSTINLLRKLAKQDILRECIHKKLLTVQFNES